jgi:hypothetical protein
VFRSKRTWRNVKGELVSGPGQSLATRGTIPDKLSCNPAKSARGLHLFKSTEKPQERRNAFRGT